MESRQTPTFEANFPADLDGDGDAAIALATAYFGEPLEWQERVTCAMLARDERDCYRVPVMGVSVPRQNGKSWSVRSRCFYGMVCNAEKILFTCQHGDTSDEMFKDLSAPFEDEDNVELHALLKAVRKTNGQQAIYLENGGMIRFTTRTNSLARGKSYDVLIYDEAQELTSAQQAASLPTISASKKKNSTQVIYLGTPPGPECCGDVFQDLHDKAHDGVTTMCWMEWAASDMGDPFDVARWYECNPSMGLLITEKAVEAEASSMASDVFARERLGWWSPNLAAANAIPAALWRSSAIDAIGDGYTRKTAFGVKFSSDGRTAAAMMVEAVNAGTVVHIGSPAMDESAKRSIRRDIGRNGAFSFGDGPDSTSLPVESAALALWAARTTKRDPTRKQRVW